MFQTKVESDSDDDEEEEKLANIGSRKDTPFEDKTFPHVIFAVDKAILREVEEMEEKVFTASLQVKVIISLYMNKPMLLLFLSILCKCNTLCLVDVMPRLFQVIEP